MSAVAEAIHAPQSNDGSTLAANKQAKVLLDLVQGKPLPVFKQTIQNLEKFHDKPNSSIPKIVETLSLDPCYAYQIFVKANTGLVKNKRQPATTLDHAILVLGVPQVIAIGEQLPLMSDQENSPAKSRISQIISRTYHAGVQARELIFDHVQTSTEEAFITAQLRNIYLVSLWFHAPEEMSGLIKTTPQQSLFNKTGILTEVGKQLSKQNHFSDLLQHSFDPQTDSERLVKIISYANQIAQLAENGWYSDQMDSLITQSSKTLGISEELLSQLSHRNAVIAAKESTFYPIRPAAYRLIETNRSDSPVAKVSSISEKKLEATPEVKIPVKKSKPTSKVVQRKKTVVKKPTSDLSSQLKILVEMGYKKRPPQEILQFSFSLLTKLSGQKPVTFFLSDKNRTLLKSRFTANLKDQKKTIILPLKQKNIFLSLMQKQQSIWINSENRKKFSVLLSAEFPIQISNTDFMAMSLFIQNKPVGLFYIESIPDQPFSPDHYQQFVSICKTTSKSLDEVKNHAK